MKMAGVITGVLVGAAVGFVLAPVQINASDQIMPYMDVYPETIEIPDEVIQAAEAYGAKYQISPELIEAIAWRESRFETDAINGPCSGLMQVNRYVHSGRIADLDANIWTADGNIEVAANYLAELFEMHEDVGVVLAAYHGEAGGVRKAENGYLSKYSRSILDLAAELEKMHRK